MATPTAKRTPAKPKPEQTTAYVVLEGHERPVQDTKRVTWEVVGTYQASSKSRAIRLHTGEGPEVKEGTFKAIPASSWKGGETTKRVQAAERVALDD